MPAIKSASRPASSIFAATACRSSESCGECPTTSRNRSCALRCSASSSLSCSPKTSGIGSTCAVRNGFSPSRSTISNLCRPSRKITTLPFGIFTVLCTLAKVPTLCKSAAAGSSTRGSCWATTPKTLSSPCNELISASELSRPTVSGRTAPGNSTVSLTGRIGN